MREVYRKFLAGNQNYDALSEILGMTRGTARNVLENPIYAGWLVYDERRDDRRKYHSERPDGRHCDRPKVARSSDDTIKVRVIPEPLISESDFARVQNLIRQKAERSIRMRQKVGQFVYSGFCWCAKCGLRLHTHRNQRDTFYYFCVGKKTRNDAGELLCEYSSYMNRDRFEPILDQLFSEQLTDTAFLRRLYDYQMAQFERDGSEARIVRLRSNIERLRAKRQRITDLYLDGELSREERTLRLSQVDRELRQAEQLLQAEVPMPVLDVRRLAELFAPFMERRFLLRNDKRRILASLGPQIQAADYQIEGMTIGLGDTNMDSRHPEAGA